MNLKSRTLATLMLGGWSAISAWAGNPQPIQWNAWSPAVFEQARRERRFVLLDLEAVWCHWCHVMDETTYANPAVIALVKSNYIAVRADQDSRPDLASRYEDYGWPATVVFNAENGEIVKRQGYIPPPEMISMLKAIIADPTPGPSVRPAALIHFQDGLGLAKELRAALEQKLQDGYDTRMASWGEGQKYMNWDNVEYCMAHAGQGRGRYETMARETLAAQTQLIDPVWGGVYQYSTDGDWKHPHFEKIMQIQAVNLRDYSLAFALWHDPKWLEAARNIDRYLQSFLTSLEGAFYTTQDADLIPGQHSAGYFKLKDAARRKLGIPRIDKHIYARENGWAIEALATFGRVTGETNQLARATRAAAWVLANRSLLGGGFRHDAEDAAGPYLGDTLAMGRAFLALYEATAQRTWLEQAEASVQFAIKTFASQPGFATAAANAQSEFPSRPEYSENVSMARLCNLLFHYTGKHEYRAAAESALRWAAAPEIAGRRFSDVGGVLLVDEELNTEPVHLTVVGSKQDAQAQSLWRAALEGPGSYRRVEWLDRAEGPLPNPDVPYPAFPYAAAFVCTRDTCSAPIKNADTLQKRIRGVSE
ncbi:MAG TPA: DUF255 domain-containing protein [Verrucomicrobiae bacterium]|jgi:hypothetical protein